MKKNKSFIKGLKRTGTKIDPWGISDKMTWKKLSVSFTLTLCFLRVKYQ